MRRVFIFNFLIMNVLNTLCYVGLMEDMLWYGLMILILLFAFPTYFFVKNDEEKLFVYPLVMAGFVVGILCVTLILFNFLGSKNVFKGWDVLVYFINWSFVGLYFIIMIAIDFIIAIVSRATQKKTNK